MSKKTIPLKIVTYEGTFAFLVANFYIQFVGMTQKLQCLILT